MNTNISGGFRKIWPKYKHHSTTIFKINVSHVQPCCRFPFTVTFVANSKLRPPLRYQRNTMTQDIAPTSIVLDDTWRNWQAGYRHCQVSISNHVRAGGEESVYLKDNVSATGRTDATGAFSQFVLHTCCHHLNAASSAVIAIFLSFQSVSYFPVRPDVHVFFYFPAGFSHLWHDHGSRYGGGYGCLDVVSDLLG